MEQEKKEVKRTGKLYTLYLPLDLAAQLENLRWESRSPSLKAVIVELLNEALAARGIPRAAKKR